MSGSATLVDAMVIITGCQQSWFERLARTVPLSVVGEVRREAAFYLQDDGTEVPIDLSGLIAVGTIRLEHASAGELAALASRCSRSGLGSGELESLAVALARGHSFCTADVRAMRTMKDLGLEAKWRPLAAIMEAAGIDTRGLGPEHGRGAWP